MTKYFAAILLVLVSLISDAQTTKSNVSMNLYGGTKNTVGFDIYGGGNILVGVGFGMYLGQSGVGEDYSQIFHWSRYRNDVYQHITAPHVSVYGITGYRINDKLSVTANFGIWTKQTYHNAVDKMGILSPNGWYYTSEDAGGSPLFGGTVSYEVNKFGAMVGYDSFSGPKFGISYSF